MFEFKYFLMKNYLISGRLQKVLRQSFVEKDQIFCKDKINLCLKDAVEQNKYGLVNLILKIKANFLFCLIN